MADTSGSEISTKIRSAIKAKLQELGAYVDEELPDYIMVMIANKKPRLQMSEDLELFLGSNSTSFTDWLHDVLDRLQSISRSSTTATTSSLLTANTSSSSSSATKDKDFRPAATATATATTTTTATSSKSRKPEERSSMPRRRDSRSEKQRRKESSNSSSKRKKSTKHADSESAYSSSYSSTSDDEKRDNDTPRQSSMEKGAKSKTENARQLPAKTAKQHVEDDVLVMQIDGDDEEFSGETADKPKYRETKHTGGNAVSVSSRPRNKRLIESSDNDVIKDNSETGIFRRMKRPAPTADEDTSSRKYRSIGDATKSDRKMITDDHLDEEYDPLKPQISTEITSVVRISERKYKIPVEMQPKPSIFLKAIKDANRSVVTKHQQRSENQMDVSATKASASSPEEDKLSEKTSVTGSKQLEKRIGRRVELRQTQNHTLKTEKSASTGDVNHDSTGSLIVDSLEAQLTRISPTSKSNTRFIVTLGGIDKSFANKLNNGRQQNDNYSESMEDLDALIVDADDQFMEDEAFSTPKTGSATSAAALRASALVNPVQICLDDDEDDDDTLHNSSNAVTVTYESQLNSGNLGSPQTITDAPKQMERCKFWPGCKAGSTCQYVHPNTNCKNFPQCRFGDKCLYIHPNCKFDSYCKNPQCPFTHSAGQIGRSSFADGAHAPNFIPCKFGGRCFNNSCPYRHPQAPCMYGTSCTRANCTYSHRPQNASSSPQYQQSFPRPGAAPKTDVAKFRWVAPQASSSPTSAL